MEIIILQKAHTLEGNYLSQKTGPVLLLLILREIDQLSVIP